MRSLIDWTENGASYNLVDFFSYVIRGDNSIQKVVSPSLDELNKIYFSAIRHNKSNLLLKKEKLVNLFSILLLILDPIVIEGQENVLMQNRIKMRLLSNYSRSYEDELLNVFIQEVQGSAAARIYQFMMLLREELNLNFDLTRAEGMGLTLRFELENILSVVFYDEAKPYLIERLDKQYQTRSTDASLRQRAFSSRESSRDEENLKSRDVSWEEIEEDVFKNYGYCTSDKETGLEVQPENNSLKNKWENLPIKWRIPIITGLVILALVMPLSLLLGAILWHGYFGKKSEKISPALQNEDTRLFNNKKPSRYRRRRISELVSDSESKPDHFAR